MNEALSPEGSEEDLITTHEERAIEEMTPEKRQHLYSEIERVVSEMPNLPPTLEPLAKLRLFNFLSSDEWPNNEQWEDEIQRIHRWSTDELEASREGSPLPTIGFEIESPEDFFGTEIAELLDRFHIPHYKDMTVGIWSDEVAPHFTYNARTAAQLMHELIELGAIPLTTSASGTKQVPEDVTIPLHVNFGLPANLTRSMLDRHDHQLEKINGLLTVAFASPTRIRTRDIGPATVGIQYKIAEKSTKNENSSTSELYRVELRAMEIRESNVYRMLMETQQLMTMCYANIKQSYGQPLVGNEQDLATMWSDLFTEASQILDEYSPYLTHSGFIDTHSDKVALLMENTDIQKRSRALISQYASLAQTELKKNQN